MRKSIRITKPQLALIKRGHPGCNFDGLDEVTFEFGRGGVVDCHGVVSDGGDIERYVSKGLYTLLQTATRWLHAQQSDGATVVQFPTAKDIP